MRSLGSETRTVLPTCREVVCPRLVSFGAGAKPQICSCHDLDALKDARLACGSLCFFVFLFVSLLFCLDVLLYVPVSVGVPPILKRLKF